jgi:hypothetical protein
MHSAASSEAIVFDGEPITVSIGCGIEVEVVAIMIDKHLSAGMQALPPLLHLTIDLEIALPELRASTKTGR